MWSSNKSKSETTTKETICPGCVVDLPSGGPDMTVGSITEEKATCFWFDDDNKLHELVLPVQALRLIEDVDE